MAIKQDLETKVAEIFRQRWEEREGTVVPDSEDVGLGNKAVNLDATVLYADLSDSTTMVNDKTKTFAAEIYKTYLYCAARIIEEFGGEVTAYDGDRVMGVFIASNKNTSAVKAAMKIHYAVKDIVNPAIVKQYGENKYSVRQVIGIDTSKLFVAKTGVRGANDLVWVGRAANYAAKLCSLRGYPIYITEEVYNRMLDPVKYTDGVDMWESMDWSVSGGTIYGSTWKWGL